METFRENSRLSISLLLRNFPINDAAHALILTRRNLSRIHSCSELSSQLDDVMLGNYARLRDQRNVFALRFYLPSVIPRLLSREEKRK